MSKINKNAVYNNIIINHKVNVDFKNVNNNLNNLLLEKVKLDLEGKCNENGFVKNDSIIILSYSSGELYSNFISYDVLFECMVANPVQNMELKCIVKSVTKIGLRCELNEKPTPFMVFIARDHHYNVEIFPSIVVNDIIRVKVIVSRYELNDIYISIIGELVDTDKKATLKNEISKTKEPINIDDLTEQM
jgi:DNA-directed RNA polymerase subunit E'/Rpb7